ncbi:MAG: MBL fold metallo-hydrolase [Gemmatimonadaceae bacterium]|nr:MBL fold metallo-hydrolase [Gemmatimonadaceae bacterium]
MLLRRFFDEQLAQTSYLAACDHARLGVIVDPNRNVAQYIEAAARDNIRIVAVTETHIHADLVSGSRELARRTNAQLYLSDAGDAEWKYGFAGESRAELLTDGSHFMIGDVRIDAIHTPGHTPEHMTFLVTDTAVAAEPMGAITGDFIFVGDVGRPDLLERAAGYAGTMETSARRLFQSLQAFKTFPDYLQIWPGHGAGSACGKALGAMPQSTLGYEKLFNWAFAEDDEERFVTEVLAGQPEPPAYFAIMKRVNRDGPADAPTTVPPVAGADEIARSLSAGETVVDTRSVLEFAARHAAGSVNIPRNRSFLNWAGSLLPYDRDVCVIGDSSEEARRQLAADLSLIGLERVSGVFPAESLDELSKLGVRMSATRQISVGDVRTRRNATILDVRGRSEFAAGHLPRALNIPLGELRRRLDEIPEGQVVVHCQGGSRSAIAASILQRGGRDDMSSMYGGFSEWERSGNPVERGSRTQGS